MASNSIPAEFLGAALHSHNGTLNRISMIIPCACTLRVHQIIQLNEMLPTGENRAFPSSLITFQKKRGATFDDVEER